MSESTTSAHAQCSPIIRPGPFRTLHGHAGFLSARKASTDFENFHRLEKAATLGGHLARHHLSGRLVRRAFVSLDSFSFAQKTDWSRRFAWQSELLAYSTELAIKHGLLPHCRFNFRSDARPHMTTRPTRGR